MRFCDHLKKARQRAGLTQQQVANALGVTKSTYCGYETGKRQPDLAKLRRLSLLLCTSVDELLELAGGGSDYAVSPSEFELVRRMRALDAHGQRLIRTVLEEEESRMHAQMRENALLGPTENAVVLRTALEPVSGEGSAYLGPDGFGALLVRRSALTESAVCALTVSGDSLLPRYRERDILLVSAAKPRIGEVGLYSRGGLGFVRLTGRTELLSVNPAYPPIALDDSIRACGTVIGVLAAEDILG